VEVCLDLERTRAEQLHDLAGLLQRHGGGCPAFLVLKTPGRSETVIALPETYRVQAGRPLKREIDAMLGYPALHTHCSPVTAPANGGNGQGRRQGGSAR